MLNAEMKIYPGKEMKALDMAEVLETSVINSGIIQGCGITLSGGALTLAPGRILIRGRLGYFSGGQIPTTGINASGTYKLLAVCDLAAQDNSMFYVDFFSTATGGDYDTLVNRVNQQNGHFNSIDGAAFIELGTATIDSATGNVTSWTASDTEVKRDAKAYAELSRQITTGLSTVDAAWKKSVNAWVSYIQKRLFSQAYFDTEHEITVPSIKLTGGAKVAVQTPALIGTQHTATGIGTHTTTAPSSLPAYDPKPVDGIPTQADTAAVRYVAKAFAGILIVNSAYVPRGQSQACGKNANHVVVAGFNITGTDLSRTAYVYLRNLSTSEAVVDVTFRLMFVRRG